MADAGPATEPERNQSSERRLIMNLIDPFQFRDLFQGVRSVAVVGNAPCIVERDDGAIIDSHDLIVRFNRARTVGLEKQVGSRTDVLFVNASNSLEKAPPPADLCQPRCLVCFVSPQGSRTLDDEPFRAWAGDCPLLWTFGPDLIGLPGISRSKPLTSGTYALFMLLRLFDVQRLFVTGFTMFGAVPGGAGKYWNEAVPAASQAHDLDQEATLFTNILKAYSGDLHVSDEVSELLSRNGFRTRPGTKSVARRKPMHKAIAEGLSWRFLCMGMAMRRLAESK
jgi:hypothetical protein